MQTGRFKSIETDARSTRNQLEDSKIAAVAHVTVFQYTSSRLISGGQMLVSNDGMLFKASRITGPTHHFLGVEFTAKPQEYSLLYCNDNEEVCDAAFHRCVRETVARLEDRLPILGRYYLKAVLVDKYDKPAADSYAIILEAIFEESERKLRTSE
jgi:hypothetical protein